jgi:predicted HicB family RNase H-like nuclease
MPDQNTDAESRGRGRPPLTDGEPRTAMLVMRVTPAFKARCTRAAQKTQQKLNAYVEQTLDAENAARGLR